MNNVFNMLQTHITGEDCYKFSKSVSYETLVGGTATIGTDIKQTQRLSEGSADKPLSAVGTLTSLLCNSAKVVEKWLQTSRDLKSDNKSEKRGKTEVCAGYRFCKTMMFLYKNLADDLLQMSPIFRLVNVLGLVAVLSFTIITESSAETWDCGKIANTVSCSLDEKGVFTITGEGRMKDYQRGYGGNDGWIDERPWGSIEIANGKFTNIQTVVVGKGVTYIGTNAFEGFSCIKELKGMGDVEAIGADAFYGTDLDNVNMPKAKTIGDYAFLANKHLKNINMPNVEVFYGHSFAATPISGYSGDCLQYKSGSCVRNDKWRCLNGYLLKENICIDSANGCGAGYKNMGGFCNRVRYTPAEAAQVLKDDDNFVILTFKK